MPIFLLLVAVPMVEIALFIQVGGLIGLWPTIGIVIVTAAIGTVLLRTQGMATLRELQRRLAEGEDPGAALAHGALILLAGVVLLTPGFFTDAVGLALLAPPVRAAVIGFLRSRVKGFFAAGSAVHPGPGGIHRGGPGMAESATVEGEFEIVEPDPASTRPGENSPR